MRTTRSRRGLTAALVLALAAGVLAMLRPWTIVPIQSTTARTFDADGYVNSIWDSRVLPAAERSAVELRIFMERQGAAPAGGPQATRAVFVRGTAIVAGVDRTSRIGLARLRLPWATEGLAVAIQIGPVLRGTALRDALEFIRFSDFVNQLEFAGVANALNGRVVTDVIGAIDVDGLAGRDVSFVGAVSTTTAGSSLEMVPVHLRFAGDAP
jgi:predicted lipoprotein